MMLQMICYAIIFLLSTLILKSILSFTRPSKKLPPSPLALPIIGHLHLLGPHMHHSFHKLSSQYGPLIHLRLGSVHCVVASTPQLAKELLKTHELTFSSRKHSAAIDYLTYQSSFAFAPYGPYWKFIKKLSTVELLGSRTLGRFLPIRRRELHCLVKFLQEKSRGGESVNVTEELLKLTNNVISQMMFSIKCSETEGQAEEARKLVRQVTEIFGEFNLSDIIWIFKNVDLQGFRKRFKDIHRRYDSLLEKIITDREDVRKEKKMKKKNGDDDDDREEEVIDFLDMLLDVLENENSEIQLSRDHIKALILDFLTAATDTTAMAVEWTLAELINNPKILTKAQNEIDQVIGKTRLVEESDIPNLPYLQAIIKETFRLHPPIPMLARKSIQDCEIDNYTIPEGTLLFVNIWCMGRDPKVWEDPLEFKPERFFQSGEKNVSSGVNNIDVKGLHYQLLPFGSGRRGCPGISLAMRELPATLAAMIHCFNWKVDGDHHGVVDINERPGLTAPRANDLLCVPVARFTPSNLDDI
ncbi:hypothetical protein Dsin_001161 [Dipteronia sinensis]|uniref:Flavone synthase II n=1 Tax=Dipteronia sinensis TaxID=43782 RepID=A0AAE0B4S5_9ROSI|nr:hypothetical protein Dsin_001161 [Dipteronia sinensis]